MSTPCHDQRTSSGTARRATAALGHRARARLVRRRLALAPPDEDEVVAGTLRTLDPRVAPIAQSFLALLARVGFKVTLTSTRRDPAQQARLYACFQKTGCSDCSKRPGQPGCYPAAAPGQSTHALGAAFDIQLDPPLYEVAGR